MDGGGLISIHAPLTGSDGRRILFDGEKDISIHAPLTGSDYRKRVDYLYDVLFQSTLPLRGATGILLNKRQSGEISIHAPLTGSDVESASTEQASTDFNPRSPYGERHGIVLPYFPA